MSDVLQSADYAGLLRGRAPVGIVQDYLLDHDEWAAADELVSRTPFGWLDVWRFIGRGSGYGRGSGIGIGYGNIYSWSEPMRVGQNYLLHLGDWHTFIGRVREQLGPLTYELEYASKVDLQSVGLGDVWHDLCAGNADYRSRAKFWHQPGRVVVPLSIVAIEWIGDLPHPKYRGEA